MPKNEYTGVAKKVYELANPIAESRGLFLWDVEFKKEGPAWFLRLYIDKEGGVTIDDCEEVSRAVDKPLDDENFIEQHYYLEVSSPGVERELKREQHFMRSLGETVHVKLYTALNGQKVYQGRLKDFRDGRAAIETGAGELSFPLSEIASAKTVFDFNA